MNLDLRSDNPPTNEAWRLALVAPLKSDKDRMLWISDESWSAWTSPPNNGPEAQIYHASCAGMQLVSLLQSADSSGMGFFFFLFSFLHTHKKSI